MNEYRKDFREVQSEAYWSLPRIALFLFLAVAVLGAGGWIAGLLSQPGRVVSKTFDADNILYNYEWFYDAYGNLRARTAQAQQFKKLLAEETDPIEKPRLRMELAAIQQSCRDLARRYNANAEKANRSIFMGRGVPAIFNTGECE